MPVAPALLSSASDEWYTPRDLAATLDAEFRFTLDPAATPSSAVAPAHFTRADDGLAQPWPGRVYVNPPYGRVMGAWVRKAYEESRARAELVVMLIPARPDTDYWHRYVMRAAELRVIRGRLRFGVPEGDERAATAVGAPFPSVVVVFRPGHEGPPALSAIDRAGDALLEVA